ncbi:MAG: NUDIX hydrolase [Pseudohongiellaceae bacterium]|nr:NUDIX hydrolase [Pseudohongiellaceae bacterium]
MKHCHHCAGPITHHVPEGDDKLRYCCLSCDIIFYQNPNNIVGTLPVYGSKVLLCRRAIEPRYNKWTLPAGFMENGETTIAGAIRESWEEAGITIRQENTELYTLFNLPYINQVYLFFLSKLDSPEYKAGAESLEVALFEEHEIPWDELAFPVVRISLEHYFADRKNNSFPVRMFDLEYSEQRKLSTRLVSSSQA